MTLFLVLADQATTTMTVKAVLSHMIYSKKREGISPSHSLRVEEIVDFFR